MRRACVLPILVLPALLARSVVAQPVPQPFPRPGESRPGASGQQPQAPPPVAAPARAPSAQLADATPDETTLGVPLYPGAQFIGSYDAGQGQRYYLFGATTPFADLVAYYRTVLKTRGELVYDEPPVHMFDTGRFREDSMAFPPSVTVKDYTWGGSKGYLVPLPGGKAQRYPSIIQIVPVPQADRR